MVGRWRPPPESNIGSPARFLPPAFSLATSVTLYPLLFPAGLRISRISSPNSRLSLYVYVSMHIHLCIYIICIYSSLLSGRTLPLGPPVPGESIRTQREIDFSPTGRETRRARRPEQSTLPNTTLSFLLYRFTKRPYIHEYTLVHVYVCVWLCLPTLIFICALFLLPSCVKIVAFHAFTFLFVTQFIVKCNCLF